MSRDPETEARLASLAAPDLSDPENPEWTKADFARARPAAAVLSPGVLAQFGKNRGGRPKGEATKQSVTLRLDPDVVAHFKASGAGWQTRINAALREKLGGRG